MLAGMDWRALFKAGVVLLTAAAALAGAISALSLFGGGEEWLPLSLRSELAADYSADPFAPQAPLNPEVVGEALRDEARENNEAAPTPADDSAAPGWLDVFTATIVFVQTRTPSPT